LAEQSVAAGPPVGELRRPVAEPVRCLVVGAGEAGSAMVRELRRVPEFGLVPVGFLDDDPAVAQAEGLPVVGPTAALAGVAEELSISVVILAIPLLPARDVRRLAEAATAAGVSVRYLPSFVAALERDARITDVRRLRVADLLGRSERHVVRPGSRRVVRGKRVLVTGAGGSIGSELCRQIRGFEPSALYLLDHDESNLHGLQLHLDGQALLDSDHLIIADIRDGARIRQVFRSVRPQVVFHAAAHKHLPLLEMHPCEAVKSNVMGTALLAEAALEVRAERFILISTDKAADPTSVLGASKRLAEMILQARARSVTKFASVRFGNVLGSRGSFLATLADQIENSEPVTVTHPDVTRFFMTVEEAVGLVIEAASMANAGDVFVLDMGDPVRIVDLVRQFAAQVHFDERELEIRFTGLRPGEKLNESLFSSGERRTPTSHPRIWATQPPPPGPDFLARLVVLYAAAAQNRSRQVRRHLARLLPEYLPSEPPHPEQALGVPYPDGF
jgi:FlaA1/EpsC-like NDP-sugar epimerase